ncbi:MAG: dienelactone hydrolase family protein [Alphaproteobacteria bacterium]|nr:dienelactone hydrolase family protein [Alphaproteobacteria bacterium]
MADIKITSKDGVFSAYLAEPKEKQERNATIIVIQEIFGVNQTMRALCDEWALQGYRAICPDLFWRQEPNLQLNDHIDEDRQKAFALYSEFDEDKAIEDLKSVLAYCKSLPDSNGKIGSVGHCLGGKLAYLMATRSDIDCSVGYYGVGIEKALKEVKMIRRPLLLHIAEEDEFVSKDAQSEIMVALAGRPHIQVYSYPLVHHAFARRGGDHWNQEAAQLADQRTREFFEENLQ